MTKKFKFNIVGILALICSLSIIVTAATLLNRDKTKEQAQIQKLKENPVKYSYTNPEIGLRVKEIQNEDYNIQISKTESECTLEEFGRCTELLEINVSPAYSRPLDFAWAHMKVFEVGNKPKSKLQGKILPYLEASLFSENLEDTTLTTRYYMEFNRHHLVFEIYYNNLIATNELVPIMNQIFQAYEITPKMEQSTPPKWLNSKPTNR